MLSPGLQTSLTVQQYHKSFKLCVSIYPKKVWWWRKNNPLALNIKSERTPVTETMFKVCVEWLFRLLCPLNLLNLKPHLLYNQNKLSLFFWSTNNYTLQDNDPARHRTGHFILREAKPSGSDIHFDLNVFFYLFHQRDDESEFLRAMRSKKWSLVKIIVWVWTRAQASCLEELKVNINVKSVKFDVSYFFLPLQRSHSSSGIITVSSNHLLYSSTKTVDSCRADERMKMGERHKEADRERERERYLLSSPFDRHFKKQDIITLSVSDFIQTHSEHFP